MFGITKYKTIYIMAKQEHKHGVPKTWELSDEFKIVFVKH